jgi:anaerobic ribonucleoside-triphosphate reductase activating protein
MVYSGYTLEELTAGRVPDAELLLNAADLLMDGPYVKDLPTQRPWRGSDNQRLIALSGRYADKVEAWNEPLGQDFEMRVSADGTLEILGIPPADLSVSFYAAAKPPSRLWNRARGADRPCRVEEGE